MHEVMPLPLLVPAVRRAEVVELLQRIHIAPSHGRMPHHTWKDALFLVMDLLLGFGKRRYFSMARVWQRASRVNIKGFSAGGYVGSWPWYMFFGKSRVSEHIVSLVQLLARRPSSRCPPICILYILFTMYPTDCADRTLASRSWIHSSASILS